MGRETLYAAGYLGLCPVLYDQFKTQARQLAVRAGPFGCSLPTIAGRRSARYWQARGGRLWTALTPSLQLHAPDPLMPLPRPAPCRATPTAPR